VVPVLRLLGPMALAGADGRSVGPPRQRLVLAVLAVDAGRTVSVERLVDRVWGSEPPPHAHRTLHAYIARIRRTLEPVPIDVERRDGAYLLCLDPLAVDLHQFRHLVESAKDPRTRLAKLREAHGLWHGQPLAGLDGPWVERTREAWRLELGAALAAWADAELEHGDPTTVVGPVSDLAAEYPLYEPLAAALIRVLARVGRAPEALRHYQAVRTRLIEDLGVDPGADLQNAQLSVLRGSADPVPVAAGVPAQLPLSPSDFVGRSRELGALDVLAAGGRSTTVTVLTGGAGTGKSALAVHWAHRAAAQFPAGQLFIDLCAFGPDEHVVTPAEALRRFLEALGVARDAIPAQLDARAAKYRSLMAGRRMLVVLDNARDTAQVRPLLPGTAGCSVVVTSRNQLTGLLVCDGGRPIAVDLLPPEEAVWLLAGRLGDDRIAAEPQAVGEIVDRCGRLPLALAVVAARAAARPGQPLADCVGGLGDPADPSTDLRTVFSWSYRALPEPAARLFRHLGRHPGPHVSTAAAASLASCSPEGVREQLAVLIGAHLASEPSTGRIAVHDLLREYAAGLLDPAERAAADRRLIDHYLHTARSADQTLEAAREPVPVEPPSPGVVVMDFADHAAALEWFDGERAALLDAVQRAAQCELDTRVIQLAWTLTDYLERRGEWSSLVLVQRLSLAASTRRGDLPAQVDALRSIARAAFRSQRFVDAHAPLLQALDLTERIGDRAGQARIYHNLAMMWDEQDRTDEAIWHVRQALDLYREVDDKRGQALALNGLGWCHGRLGDHAAALSAGREALTLLQTIGERSGEADAWDSVAHAYCHLGDIPAAIRHYRQANELYRELGHRYREADSLTRLGEAYEAGDDRRAALDAWRRALAIFNDLGHPSAEPLRARIASFASALEETVRP
jgi:DNA-binding SARP family transcriptional activator/tetratricopeptide (TPR) repeat protein